MSPIFAVVPFKIVIYDDDKPFPWCQNASLLECVCYSHVVMDQCYTPEFWEVIKPEAV